MKSLLDTFILLIGVSTLPIRLLSDFTQPKKRDEMDFSNAGQKPLSLNFIYGHLRRHVVHEDELINNRLNWLVFSQTFLFVAYGTAESNKLWTLRSSIPLVGIAMNILTFLSIYGAVRAMRALREYWRDKKKEHKIVKDEFPPLQGKDKALGLGLFAPCFVPLAFLVCWFWLRFGEYIKSHPHYGWFILLGVFVLFTIWLLVDIWRSK